jgi:hypothetical protein
LVELAPAVTVAGYERVEAVGLDPPGAGLETTTLSMPHYGPEELVAHVRLVRFDAVPLSRGIAKKLAESSAHRG